MNFDTFSIKLTKEKNQLIKNKRTILNKSHNTKKYHKHEKFTQ